MVFKIRSLRSVKYCTGLDEISHRDVMSELAIYKLNEKNTYKDIKWLQQAESLVEY
jgi:hypothetical protein